MNYIQENNFTKNYFIMENEQFHNNNENKIKNKFYQNPSVISDDEFMKNNFYPLKNSKNINLNLNGNNSNNLNKNYNYRENNNNNNIFGLNFHQDEENENEIVNSLHFSKFIGSNKTTYINYNKNISLNIDYNNKLNNYEQKIKNNRNIISNNMKNSLLMDDEPFQISNSKYTESNIENQSIYNNSNININYKNNIKNNIEKEPEFFTRKNNFNQIGLSKNNYINNNKNTVERNKTKIYNKSKEHMKLDEEQINLKKNLLLNNKYMNNIQITKNKKQNIIKHNKSFSTNRNLLNNNHIYKNNSFIINKNYKTHKNKNINNYAYNIENNCNNMDNNNNIKKKINSDRIHNINNSNIPKCNPNYNIIIKEDNLKKIYSKRQKAELDMVRGLLIYDKKSFNFNIKNGNLINYFKFLNPTEPIIQINYRNIDKFYPLIRKNFISELCNNSNNNHFNNNNNDSQYQTFIDKNKIYNLIDNKKNINPNNINTKIISNKIFPNEKANFQIHNQKEKINKKNYEYFVYNENNEKIRFKTDENGLSMNFKKKIYDWLVDINIIKDKVIKIDSLPTLCINGVLLCDLINRCEGKNEILKGIIRRTSTRSQIQVNINKALEYLRSKEKFPSRHLWDNLEISRGNSLIIWQLLEDIYNFYGNKVTFERRIKKNSIKNQLNKTFTEENNKNFIKEDLEFNNFYSNTPLKERKMKTINAFRNKFANEINNSKHSSTSNMNKNTKNKIVENINTNKNKNILNYNKNKNENIHNINNFELRKESYNRNNLNHTNDNFYESEMFSIDNCMII